MFYVYVSSVHVICTACMFPIPLIITPPENIIHAFLRSFQHILSFKECLQLILCNEMKLNLQTNVSKSLHPNIKQRNAEMYMS